MTKLFGTNGIRDVVNDGLTPNFIADIVSAIASTFKGTIVVGADARLSSPAIKSIVIGTLAMNGIDVIDLGYAPTPAIQLYVKNHSEINGGVIITASHNPPEFNGIKCLSSDGSEIDKILEDKIEEIYFNKRYAHRAWNDIGRISKTEVALPEYIDKVVAHLPYRKKIKTLKVVIDGANSVGSLTSPFIVEKMGHIPITINGNLQGTFLSRQPEPVKENLQFLMETVKVLNADVGIAHDGDADRCVFIDNKGNFIPGEYSLAIIARDIVSRNGKGLVVTPISTSSIVEKTIKEYNGIVKYTKVGAPPVISSMKEYNAIFGGEENGGLIFPFHLYARDGGMSLAYMLSILESSEMSLNDLFSSMPKLGFVKKKVYCPDDKKMEIMKNIESSIENVRYEKIDGIKIHHDDCWVLIRPSGTESIIRIYAEAETEEKAQHIAEDYIDKINEIIKM
jgi:phosphomannomutase/phosphoglucomutase